MPGKSHRKDKFKAQAASRQPASVTPPAVSIGGVETSAVRQSASSPPAAQARNARPVPVSTATYINRELLTISLLACSMMALVIIVSFILR